MLDPELQERIVRVMDLLQPGWTFSIGSIVGNEGEAFVLSFSMAGMEWLMAECTFDEALFKTEEILESFQWN